MPLLKLVLLALLAYVISARPARAQAPAAGPALDPHYLRGTLTDRHQRPLAYVSIGVPGTPVGTVAAADGRFVLRLPAHVQATDTVRFSLLGYAPLSLPVAALRARLATGQPLRLAEAPTALAEVRVTGARQPTRTLGGPAALAVLWSNLALSEQPDQNLGAEVGRRFDLPRGTCALETFRFRVASNFDSVTFRVSVYAARGMRPLLARNVYVPVVGRGDRWVEVDLRPYRVVADANVVVAVQWVARSAKGSFLGMPISMPAAALHLYKYGSQDRWKKFPGMTTAMKLTVARLAAPAATLAAAK